jgi:hypothetical protein
VFEVRADEELVFSKKALRRHAEPGEVAGLIRERRSGGRRDEDEKDS